MSAPSELPGPAKPIRDERDACDSILQPHVQGRVAESPIARESVASLLAHYYARVLAWEGGGATWCEVEAAANAHSAATWQEAERHLFGDMGGAEP